MSAQQAELVDAALEELRGRVDALQTMPILKQPGEAVAIMRGMLNMVADIHLAISLLTEIAGKKGAK